MRRLLVAMVTPRRSRKRPITTCRCTAVRSAAGAALLLQALPSPDSTCAQGMPCLVMPQASIRAASDHLPPACQ